MSTTASGVGEPRPDASQRSFGELVGEVAQDLSTLVRQEMDLAKAELRQEATKAGRAAGSFGAAGVAGHMVLLFLSFALWWALANGMDEAWAALIVAAVWAVAAAVLFAMARAQVRRVRGLTRTTETVKQIPDALTPDRGDHR
jgi:hypothetical protein